jgi:hypothetical protein
LVEARIEVLTWLGWGLSESPDDVEYLVPGHTAGGDIGNTIPPTTPAETVHLTERFKVDSGLITEIEGIFSVGTTTLEGSGWPAPTG